MLAVRVPLPVSHLSSKEYFAMRQHIICFYVITSSACLLTVTHHQSNIKPSSIHQSRPLRGSKEHLAVTQGVTMKNAAVSRAIFHLQIRRRFCGHG